MRIRSGFRVQSRVRVTSQRWNRAVLVTLGLVAATACAAEPSGESGESPSDPSAVSSAATEDTKEGSALQAIDDFIASQSIDKTNPSWRLSVNRPPEAEFDADKTYYWMLETSLGQIKIKLFADSAPMHVSSTIYLTRIGFYDGLGFHRADAVS